MPKTEKRSVYNMKKSNLSVLFAIIFMSVMISIVYFIIPTFLGTVLTSLTTVQLVWLIFGIQVLGSISIGIAFIYIATKVTKP